MRKAARSRFVSRKGMGLRVGYHPIRRQQQEGSTRGGGGPNKDLLPGCQMVVYLRNVVPLLQLPSPYLAAGVVLLALLVLLLALLWRERRRRQRAEHSTAEIQSQLQTVT